MTSDEPGAPKTFWSSRAYAVVAIDAQDRVVAVGIRRAFVYP